MSSRKITRFTEFQMSQLEKNVNILHVSESSITYEPNFKVNAVKAYQEGKKPMDIFLAAGFEMDVIGRKKPKQCLKRWRAIYALHGEAGLIEEQRGKGSSGRPAGELAVEEKLRRAEARIKFLEAENDFLKKLEALERRTEL